MTAVTSGLEGSLPPPGVLPALGMHYKMSYTRDQAVARAPPPRPGKPRHRSSATDGHFDADELSRRLYLVLADQRAHSERKRRARADAAAKARDTRPLASAAAAVPPKDGAGPSTEARPKAPTTTAAPAPRPSETSTDLISELRRHKSAKANAQRKPSKLALVTPSSSKPTDEPMQYHHVPREAAKQFTRTTTVDGMRDPSLAHKPSDQPLKFHPGGARSNHRAVSSDPNVAALEIAQSLQRGQSQREKAYDRNHGQSQRTRTLEEADEEHGRGRGAELQQRHTLQADRFRIKPDPHQLDPRRNSTGDMLRNPEDHRHGASLPVDSIADAIDEATPPDEPERPAMPPEPRVDWTQSDEVAQRHKPLLSPLLRKADSIWALRGRLGSKGSAHEKGELQQVPETPKSPKSGFFAKFKR